MYSRTPLPFNGFIPVGYNLGWVDICPGGLYIWTSYNKLINSFREFHELWDPVLAWEFLNFWKKILKPYKIVKDYDFIGLNSNGRSFTLFSEEEELKYIFEELPMYTLVKHGMTLNTVGNSQRGFSQFFSSLYERFLLFYLKISE